MRGEKSPTVTSPLSISAYYTLCVCSRKPLIQSPIHYIRSTNIFYPANAQVITQLTFHCAEVEADHFHFCAV